MSAIFPCARSPVCSRGAAVVEFAIALPVFLLVFYGLVTFGMAFYTQLAVSRAAEDGARAVGFLTDTTDYTPIKNEVLNSLANSVIAPVGHNGSYTARRSWLQTNVLPQISVTPNLSCADTALTGALRVKVVYPYNSTLGTRVLPSISIPGIGSTSGWMPSTLVGCAVVQL